ncbi:MAG: amidohydrolase [Bacteroidales bacterium]
MKDLKITIIQSDLVWENPTQNLANFGLKIAGITENPDIIVLPEMFNTAFSINPAKCAETMDGISVSWMKSQATANQCVITGSILINENGKYFNRLIWMQADGEYFTYDKRHLFRMSEEFNIFNEGHQRSIVECKGWRINLNICYDLRFPVWSRNTYKDGAYEYDLMIYVANWPSIRSSIWQTLLKARAIENQSYVIGVNRVGTDGHGAPHSGDSMIIDPIGNLILQASASNEEIHTLVISRDFISDFRKNFTAGLDWDDFKINC